MKIGTSIRLNNIKLIRLNERLRRVSLELINMHPDVNTPRDGVVLFSLIKAYKTHGAILLLINKGLIEDAEMLARTLFDICLLVKLCTKDDSEEMALQYFNFDEVQRSKLYKKVKDNQNFSEVFKDRITNPKEGDEDIDKIINSANELVERYGKWFKDNWFDKNKQSEYLGSLQLDHYYKTAFDLQSQLIHSTPRSMNRYFKDVGGKIITNHEPNDEHAGLALVSAVNMIILIADEYQRHFKYEYQEVMDSLASELKVATTDLE